jgi:hypothetical protein
MKISYTVGLFRERVALYTRDRLVPLLKSMEIDSRPETLRYVNNEAAKYIMLAIVTLTMISNNMVLNRADTVEN